MINRQVLFIYFFSSFLLLGCADTKILERVSLAILIGFDITEDNKISTTAALRTVNQDLQSVVSIASETAETTRGTRIKVSLDSTKKVVAGQLRVVLIGDKLAKNGINETLHTLKMNSEMSSGLYIAVVDGETKPLIDKKYEGISDIGQHIYYLLEHNIDEQFIISSTLHETVRDSYSLFTDVALPLLEQDEDDVQISGLALFNDDKMVGKITADEIFYVVLLRQKYKAGSVQLSIPGEAFDVPDEFPLAIDSIFSNRKLQLVNKEIPEFNLNLSIEGRLLEIPSIIKTESPEVISNLENEIEKKLKEEMTKILKKTQEFNSDIFGFGEVYKAHIGAKNLDREKWNELYPKMKVNVNLSVELLRNGIFD